MAASSEPRRDERSGFLPDRIVHLHPTRLCNLACAHCYSSSSPSERAALDPQVVISTLQVLRQQGYGQVSVSGGEPLLYRGLREVVEACHALGYRVTMVSNGLLVDDRHAAVLAGLDGIAVSFDGLEASHNAIRGRADAFAKASAAVARLAGWRLPVVGAVSVTPDALPDVPELVDHIVGLGARAVQVRPVAAAGRARSLGARARYSEVDYARLYLVVLALQQELPDVQINSDVAPALGLWQQRDRYAALLADCASDRGAIDRPLAELVNPIVVTDSGVVKPLAFDFHSRFDVGTVGPGLVDELRVYRQQGLPLLQRLVGGALAALEGRRDVVDWFDHCTRLSETPLAA